MSHPYKAFMANQHNEEDYDATKPVAKREIHLSPVEEHYLKKSLIKNQIVSELNSLSPDYQDTSGLRRFGPPFVPADPRSFLKNPDSSTLEQIYAISEQSIDIFRSQFPLLRFVFENYIVTFPFIKIHLDNLGATNREQSKFWMKIQVLFELFKGKRISNSNDRGSTSKRKLILYKFQGLFLTLFNSSIYSLQDPQYFEMDRERRGAYKKLSKFVDAAEAQKLQEEEKKLEGATDLVKQDMKPDSYLLDLNLSPENLLNHLDDIEDDEYINGYYINVVGVSIESETKSSFWGSKDNKYYTFIIHVKTPGKPGWLIKRRYSEFHDLYKNLKMAYPGCHIPDLPSKDKHVVEMNLDSGDNIDDKNNINSSEFNNLHNFEHDFSDIDKASVDALFTDSIGSPKLSSVEAFNDASSELLSVSSDQTTTSSEKTDKLKSPKLSLNSFMKPTFLKSPISSPLLPSRSNSKNINIVEKSFLSSFKKSSKSASSPVSEKRDGHHRTSSIDSEKSDLSVDSIETDETNGTFHSATEGSVLSKSPQQLKQADQGKIVFPREILRQSLRGFLKYLLYVKTCAKSSEVFKFLCEESKKVELTKHDIHDIQHRINIDHLRTVQHYKFQSALVGIVKVLEKDVQTLKVEIYNEGFNYVFDRIKIHKTLHELCGYDSNINSHIWLQNANLVGSSNEDVLTADSDSKPKDSSAPLRGLVRIVLLEIASTQYELLLGSDSAMSTLKTLKRLHAVFPYRLVAGVLRFTNPLMMVKRLIDVFTYQMPSVPSGVNAISNGIGGMMQGLGLGKWKSSEPEKDVHGDAINSSKKSGRSLLQLIFSGMLGEDIRKLEKESVEIRDCLTSFGNDVDVNNERVTSNYGEGEVIMERIDKYFASDDAAVLHIKEMSKLLGLDIVTTILLPNNGLKDCDDLGSSTISAILQDYAQFSEEESLRHKEGVDSSEKTDEEGKEKSSQARNEDVTLYRLAKRYFFLQLRKYDKEGMVELWNEPELMNVIKEVISLFLSPLIDLFKKAEVYKYVPIFARYISELLDLCEVYANDYGQFGRSDVVGSLVGLEEKYSEDVYKFIRDMYLNDIEGDVEKGHCRLFEGIVDWLNGIIKFLRFVKRERPELMIDLNKMLNGMELSRDEKLEILKAIGKVVAKAERKRKVLEQMEASGELDKKAAAEARDHDWTKMARDRKVDSRWDEIHSRVFRVGEHIASTPLGAGDGDLYDVLGLGEMEGDDLESDSDAEPDHDAVAGAGADAESHAHASAAGAVPGISGTLKKFKDYDWDVGRFLEAYYSEDWTRFDMAQLVRDLNTNEFMDGMGCGVRIARSFKQELLTVLNEFENANALH